MCIKFLRPALPPPTFRRVSSSVRISFVHTRFLTKNKKCIGCEYCGVMLYRGMAYSFVMSVTVPFLTTLPLESDTETTALTTAERSCDDPVEARGRV